MRPFLQAHCSWSDISILYLGECVKYDGATGPPANRRRCECTSAFMLRMAVIVGTDRGVGNQGNAKTPGRTAVPGFGIPLHPGQ